MSASVAGDALAVSAIPSDGEPGSHPTRLEPVGVEDVRRLAVEREVRGVQPARGEFPLALRHDLDGRPELVDDGPNHALQRE